MQASAGIEAVQVSRRIIDGAKDSGRAGAYRGGSARQVQDGAGIGWRLGLYCLALVASVGVVASIALGFR